MQQPVGKHMAALGVGAKLDLVYREEIAAHPIRHRLDRANPILGAVRHNPLFAGDQSHDRRAPGPDDPVIYLAREQTQRQADDAGAVAQHPLDGIMGFSGIGRTQYSRDPGFGRHGSPRGNPLQGLAFQHDGKLSYRIRYCSVLGKYSLNPTIQVQGVLITAQFAQNNRKAKLRPEMLRIELQRLGQILNGGSDIICHVIGFSAGIVGFGKIRGMVDGRREMFHRADRIARLPGVKSALHQQVDGGRA